MTTSSTQSADVTTEIKAAIRAFILEKFPASRQKSLEDSDSLIESGMIDSMGMLELVIFVESNFGLLVEDIDLTPENFESIVALSTFVAAKKRK